MIIFTDQRTRGLFNITHSFIVYASYPDVSAEDFLFVQTDTTYRKVWDKSAITLDIVDQDPVNKAESQIIYWEMLWPVSIS